MSDVLSSFDASVLRFVEEGWSLHRSAPAFNNSYSMTPFAKISIGHLRRKDFHRYKAFFAIFNREVLEVLLVIINSRLEMQLVNASKKDAYLYRPVTLDLLVRVLGTFFLLSRRSECVRIKGHLRALRREGWTLPAGDNRIATILGAFLPTNAQLEQFVAALCKASQATVLPGGVLTFDEWVIGYNPGRATVEEAKAIGDPIPLGYYPNKPHPNGLVVYVASVPIQVFNTIEGTTTTLPYSISYVPWIGTHPTAQGSISKVLAEWKYDVRPVIVADRAFGSVNMAEQIIAWGGSCILSISKNNLPWLWCVVNHSLPPNAWRVVSKQGAAWAISTATNNEAIGAEIGSHHQVIFSGHTATSVISYSSSSSSSSASGAAAPIETSTTTIAGRPWAEFEVISDYLKELTTTNKNDLPIFTQEQIDSFKLEDLRLLCAIYGISRSGSKAAVAERVSRRMQVLQSHMGATDRLKEDLQQISYPRPGFPHSYYKTHFNLVDLHDRYFYTLTSDHYSRDWRKVFLLGFLHSALINVWVVQCSEQYEMLRDFRTALAAELLDITLNEIPDE